MKKLDALYLIRYSAQNPLNANGLGTLEGMTEESCIFGALPQIVPPYQYPAQRRGLSPYTVCVQGNIKEPSTLYNMPTVRCFTLAGSLPAPQS